MSRRLGTLLAITWAICVLVAFSVYPKPDNLVVSYPVFLAFGEEGVEQLTGIAALAISAVQVLLVFCVGHLIGRWVWRRRSDNDAC